MFKLKNPIVKEKIIEKEILSYLWIKKIFAFKVENQGTYNAKSQCYQKRDRFHTKGLPDIMGFLPPNGRFFAIEVKSIIGRVTPEQSKFLESLNACGGLGFVARSFKEVEEKLKLEGVIV